MKPLSVSSRLTVLIVLAVIFGATVIALSVRPKAHETESVFRGDNEKKFEQTFIVQPDGQLSIDADIGNISIVGTESEEVSIKVFIHGSESKMRKYDVNFLQEGNDIKIIGKLKGSNFQFFHSNWLDVMFEVKVPKKYHLNLNTSGGNIEIENVNGKIEGETSGGNIDLAELESELKMSTSGGNVALKNASGDFDLETSGGNMVGESIIGPIRMETSGGNIDIRNSDGKVFASTSGGNIRVQLKDNKGVDLETSGGNINVELPETISADVSAEALGGDVSCDLEFSGKIKDGTMRAKIKGGGNVIHLETSGGDITISPLN